MRGVEPVLKQSLSLPLFSDDLLEPFDQLARSNQALQRDFWVRSLDEIRELSAGLCQLGDIAAWGNLPRNVNGSLDVVSEHVMALPGLTGSDLQRHRVKR